MVTTPKVGDWYQALDGSTLEVVAYDAEDDCIEVQFYDGTVEEYDQESWTELVLQSAEPPEDWGAGSYDLSLPDEGIEQEKPAGNTPPDPLSYLDELDRHPLG